MTELYRRVDIVNGETAEPVHFVGIHPVAWGEALQPTVGFVEYTGPDPERLAEACKATAAVEHFTYVDIGGIERCRFCDHPHSAFKRHHNKWCAITLSEQALAA